MLQISFFFLSLWKSLLLNIYYHTPASSWGGVSQREPSPASPEAIRTQLSTEQHHRRSAASPTPRVSDTVGLVWGQPTCISSEFLGGADAAGLQTTLRERLLKFISVDSFTLRHRRRQL